MTNLSSLAEPPQPSRPALSRRSGPVGLNRGYLSCRNAGAPESPRAFQMGSPSFCGGASPIERVSLSSLPSAQRGTSGSRIAQRSPKSSGPAIGNSQFSHTASHLAPPPPVEFDLDYGSRSFSSSRVGNSGIVDELSALSHKSYRMASGSRVGRRHGTRTARNGSGELGYLNGGATLDTQRAASMSRTRQQCFKTKMCHFFVQQKCSRGAKCVFAHSSSELRLTPDLSKTKICVKWKKGLCTDSSQCNYAHGVEDLQPQGATHHWPNPVSQVALSSGDQDNVGSMNGPMSTPVCHTTRTSTCASVSDVANVHGAPQLPDCEKMSESSMCEAAPDSAADSGALEAAALPTEEPVTTGDYAAAGSPQLSGELGPSVEDRVERGDFGGLKGVGSSVPEKWDSPEPPRRVSEDTSADDQVPSQSINSPPPTEEGRPSRGFFVEGQAVPDQPPLRLSHSYFPGRPVPFCHWGYSDVEKRPGSFPVPTPASIFQSQQAGAALALRSVTPYGGGQLNFYPSYPSQPPSGGQTSMERGLTLLSGCPPVAQPVGSPLQKQPACTNQTVSSPMTASSTPPAPHRVSCGAMAQPAQQHYIYHNGYLVPVVFATSIPRRSRDCGGAVAMYPMVPCSPHALSVPHHFGHEAERRSMI